MGEIIEETLKCMGWFFCSLLLGSGIELIPYAFYAIIFTDKIMPYWLNLLLSAAGVCLACCILMFIYGYKSNLSYKKKPVKQLLIPIITAVVILSVTAYFFLLPANDNYSIYDKEELIRRHRISCVVQAVFSMPSMVLGYYSGYKKSEKERAKMLSKKQ
jgi:uncharacterized membrane-anchored protein